MSRRALGTGALALLLTAGLFWQHGCGSAPEPRSRARGPNVVLLVLDTLRADMVSGPAGEPGQMPFVHGLARRGVLFPNAIPAAPWTLPSVTSLLTGLMPRDHRVDRIAGRAVLPSVIRTWAQAFNDAGYATAGYTGGPWDTTSILRDFGSGDIRWSLNGFATSLESWRRSVARDRPFLLLLHSFEAHDPYGAANHPAPGAPRPPPPPLDPLAVNEPWERARRFMLSHPERKLLNDALGEDFMHSVVRYLWSGYRAEPRPALAAELRAAYVEGVRWLDGLVKDLYAWLEDHGLLENTVLVVTSDHGEAFGEHGYLEHGRQLFDEVLRVPIVLLGPGALQGGRVVPGCVSLMDLMPTLAEIAGASPPAGSVGTSLRRLIEGATERRIAETHERLDINTTQEDIERVLRSARSDRWKAILEWDLRSGAVREHGYDLLADPDEKVDLGRGTGSLAGVEFDPAFCAVLDRLRAELVAEGATAPLPPPCGR